MSYGYLLAGCPRSPCRDRWSLRNDRCRTALPLLPRLVTDTCGGMPYVYLDFENVNALIPLSDTLLLNRGRFRLCISRLRNIRHPKNRYEMF